LLATVAPAIRLAALDLSVGSRDHTISLVRIGLQSSLASQRVHRIPASRFVTIGRNAPLDEAGWFLHTPDLVSEKAKCFC